MKMNRLFLFGALVALLVPVSLHAQTAGQSIPKVEISVGGGVGMTGYMPFFSTAPWTKGAAIFDNYTSPKWIPGIGGRGGLYVDINFTDNWGLITGAEFAAYLSEIRSEGLLNSANYDCGFEYIMNTPPLYPFTKGMGTGTNNDGKGWFVTRLENFKETHKMFAVQVPIMAKYMAPLSAAGGHKFYVAFGTKIGVHVTPDIWSQSWDDAKYNSFFTGPYYGISKDKLGGAPVIPFMHNEGQETIYEDTRRETGTIKNNEINRIDVMVSFDTGFRWKLSPSVGLYTGFYFDFGLIRPLKVVDGKVLNINYFHWENPIHDPFKDFNENPAKWYEVPVASLETKPATYNSILAAQGPDYYDYQTATNEGGRETVKTSFTDDTKPYARMLSNMQAGITVRFAFGKAPGYVKPPKAPKEPKVKTPKEPKVKPEKPKEVPQDIQQTMIELSDALFAFDKFDLNDEAKALLDKVTDWLKSHPDLKVEIAGHTDSKGSDAYNQKLSENRAKAVYDYIVNHGVDSSRLSYKGYGESQPIATNDTDEGRQKNRRVELKILE